MNLQTMEAVSVQSAPMAACRRGHYLGPQIGWRWWFPTPYLRRGLIAGGWGEYRFTPEALLFRRKLTRNIIRLDLASIREVRIGGAHGGHWLMWQHCLRIRWVHEGTEVISGFIVSTSGPETGRIGDELISLARVAGAALEVDGVSAG
jgi:hypothetical protein